MWIQTTQDSKWHYIIRQNDRITDCDINDIASVIRAKTQIEPGDSICLVCWQSASKQAEHNNAATTKLMVESPASVSTVVTQRNPNVASPQSKAVCDGRKDCPKCGRNMKEMVLELHLKLHAASGNRADEPASPKEAVVKIPQSKIERLRQERIRNEERRRLRQIEYQQHIAEVVKAVESLPPKPAEKPKDFKRYWIRLISTPM